MLLPKEVELANRVLLNWQEALKTADSSSLRVTAFYPLDIYTESDRARVLLDYLIARSVGVDLSR